MRAVENDDQLIAALPLSTAQMGMWLGHQLDPTERAGTLAEYLDIRGHIDPSAWEHAWRVVLADTDACRVRIVEDAGVPAQVVDSPVDGSLSFVDLSGTASPGAAATELMRADLSGPMDLGRGTAAFALLKVADDRFLWYHRYHHIAIDYYGIVLVARRLAEVYTALAGGSPRPPSTFGRLHHVLEEEAEYRRSAQYARDRRYWLDVLDGLPAAPELHGRGGPAGDSLFRTTFLPGSLLGAVRGVAKQVGTSWSRVVMAAAAAYLFRMTGKQDIVLGLPVACRTTPAARSTPSLLANVVPQRLAVRPETTLAELVAQAARSVDEALPHQRYRYEDLRRDLAIGADRGIFGWTVNVMSFENELRFAGQPATRHNLANGPVDDLSIYAFHRSGDRSVQADFTANPARYQDEDVAVHQRGFLSLLRAMVAEPKRRIGELDPLDPAERRRVLVEWGGPGEAVPQATFPALFEACVRRAPQAAALVFEGTTLSYADLNARANRLAHNLIVAGVGPGKVVALACGRTVEGVVGLLAILKAGAAYLPVDVDYPQERIAFMLGDARPVMTLVTRATAGRLDAVSPAARGLVVVDLPETVRATGAHPDRDPTDDDRVRPLRPSCPAYVIYTSGSTGTPNGVVVGHAGLAGLVAAQVERFGITAASRILQFASPGFDGAVAEVVTALGSGAALVLAPTDRLVPGEPLAALSAEAGVTHITLPPTVLAAVPEDGLPGVVTLAVAGEPCPPEVVRRWAGGRRMVNAYGPTEATVCVTMSEPLAAGDEMPAIGRPIAGVCGYVLDSTLHPVAPGAVGQLYLAGAGLAHGYLGRPTLTAERFLPNPFGPPGSRMYRTGDLVRWRTDGALEFVARVDDQVSLRGFRIEPGEVEAVLVRHATVAQAAVAVCENKLVGYVVPAPDRVVETGALRRFASARLPGYLVPSAFVALDRLPLTPNGKLDRRALPRPATGSPAGRLPGTPLEELLCRVYAEVLGRTEVRPEDDFFALGGDSLLAMHLAYRLRRVLPVEVSMTALFQAPTVAELVDRLGAPDVDPFDGLLRIRPWPRPNRSGGDRPPLFCLPPASGLSWCYTGLREHLPADLPIYGLQARIAGPAAPSIERLAAEYLDRIREVQPADPYHLLGWSLGGHLAHAIATKLRQQGERVALLVILDAYPHDPRLSTNGGGASDAEVLARTIDRVASVPLSAETAAAVARMATYHARLAAGHRWRRYDGDLLFFTAADGRTPASPTASAWRPYVTGDITNHEVPCGHFEMTEPRALAAIGAVLTERMTGRTSTC
jgi:enterobactin synthetase component F